MASPFDAYLTKLRETPLDEHTEHTGRSALEALLNRFAAEAGAKGITVQHEPKREADKGAPDFKIKRQGMILGYVENKAVGENLDKVLKSDQIRNYRELSDNILLTDYLQWIWIDRERVKGREILAFPTDLEGRTLRVAPERAEAVGKSPMHVRDLFIAVHQSRDSPSYRWLPQPKSPIQRLCLISLDGRVKMEQN